jgi:hypothetical protein
MLHVVCYSGGHSSGLVSVEVARRFGIQNLVLLNHDIAAHVEHADIKRFKQQLAERIGVPITYANHPDLEEKQVDQFDVTMHAKAFKVQNGQELCTSRLKTEPFMKWLAENAKPESTVIYYGFDANERHRIQRRSSIMGAQGWKTDYPLALWPHTITSTHEVGVPPPLVYDLWKHANCLGCLKAGKQHWYIVYLYHPEIWAKGKMAEEVIGHSIHKDVYLDELEDDFAKMKAAGVTTTEHEDGRTFFARARMAVRHKYNEDLFFGDDEATKPCECIL